MSSNTSSSRSRRLFGRRRGEEQSGTSQPSTNTHPAPAISFTPAESPVTTPAHPLSPSRLGVREKIQNVFRTKSRNQSPDPTALGPEGSTLGTATSIPIDITLSQPTEASGAYRFSEPALCAELTAAVEDVPPKPTIEEAKAAEQIRSRACQNMTRVCGGLRQLAKRIEPLLDGTPFKTPVAVFNAIADAFEVCIVTIFKAFLLLRSSRYTGCWRHERQCR